MKTWSIELITNGIGCNPVEIDADVIIKEDYYTLNIDGYIWKLDVPGMSFAEVEEAE